jgi:serine/threonine protein kinase
MSPVPVTEPHDREHPLIGAVLRGSYRIVRVLDQGGMGTVFEAEHVRLHRRLAVKVLAEHLAADPQALARFHREAEIISHLSHPNIVQLVDYDAIDGGKPYIVMEFLEGESLEARLERERRIDLPTLARIVHQVALGLAAAHRAAIVHRDLKPANIFLVERAGENTLVKLLDFGISLHSGVGRRITGEFDVLGTPDYMPPEQAAGQTARVDQRGDQYSLAVIAYEALCGQTPFPGKDVMSVLRQVLSSEPMPIDRLAPELPAGVWPVLKRALAKSPAERYPGVLELAGALLSAAGCSVPPDPRYASVPPATLGRSSAPPPNSAVNARGEGRYRGTTPSGESAATEPPGAPSPPAVDPEEIGRALLHAREAFGMSEVDLAVSYVERAMQVADAIGAVGSERLDSDSALIESILQSRVGPLAGRLVVRRVPSTPGDLRIRPQQAFLLSRLEGHSSVEELLDLSPLPRRETLRHLVSMLQKGVLGVE